MKRWEYKVVRWTEMEQIGLQNLGHEGWELVAIMGSSFDARFYFKRRKA